MKRDHEPRFAIDWACDLTGWDLIDQEAEPWVIYTRARAAPHANSSGCVDNKNTPVVRLRWTDRDLLALAAHSSVAAHALP
jgi:hypothetical protein